MIGILPVVEGWGEQVGLFISQNWGSQIIVSRGQIHEPALLPGFMLVDGGAITALITYEIKDRECEIVSLDSRQENQGIGTALVKCVVEAARENGCRRIWLVTTNDNIRGIRFYQKRGFNLAALHTDAVNVARELKPEIPLLGWDGIPIHHELEFELYI